MRVRTLEDMFNRCGPILQTITKDPVTERIRTVKPGEESKSIWANLHSTARAIQFSPSTNEQKEGLDDTYKYTEADELEDAILFPGEATGMMKDNLFKENPSLLDTFEKKPMFNIRKFANDADTDDSFSEDSDLEDLETDDEDEDWEDEEPARGGWMEERIMAASTADAIDKAMEIATEMFRDTIFLTRPEPDYFLPVLNDPAAATWIPPVIRSRPREIMSILRQSM